MHCASTHRAPSNRAQAFLNPHGEPERAYDMILSAETVYAPESIAVLADLLAQLLRRPDGVAYVAGKAHYFGVGGGTRVFLEAVRAAGRLRGDVCWSTDDGVHREILELRPLA